MSSEPRSSRSWTSAQSRCFETDSKGQFALRELSVMADAGAGKTSVLVERIKKIPQSERVLCVSFTERSKKDLEDRLVSHQNVEVYTIHGFCARLVEEFKAFLQLPPQFTIGTQAQADVVFIEAFEKVFRRSPPQSQVCRDWGAPRILEFLFAVKRSVEGVRPEKTSGIEPEFLQDVLSEFERSKRKQSLLEYDDLEKYAAALCGSEEVVALLAKRYQHLFIDEFQDTNQRQAAFLRSFHKGLKSFFVVGDVKQSIYRFRGADVSVFLKVAQECRDKEFLQENFRSHEKVIEFVNEVSRKLFDRFSPMVAGRTENKLQLDGKRVFCFEFEDGKADRCEAEAASVVAAVNHLRGVGFADADIVMLVDKIQGNFKLFDAISARGLSLAVAASSSAKISKSSREPLAILCNLWLWAVNPSDRMQSLSVFLEHIEGFQLTDFETMFERCVHELRGLEGVACTELLLWLEERFLLRARFVLVFEQFRLFILEKEVKRDSPADIAREFERVLNEEQSVEGFRVMALPKELQNSVRVMTVHASKGLEFKAVVMPALLPPRSQPRKSFLVSRGSAWIFERQEDGTVDPGEKELCEAIEAESREQESEKNRLLYVALTRAEEAICLVTQKIDEKKKKSKTYPVSWRKPIDEVQEDKPSMIEAVVVGSITEDRASQVMSQPSSAVVEAPIEATRPAYARARVGVIERIAQSSVEAPALRPSAREPMLARLDAKIDAAALGTQIHSYLEKKEFAALKEFAVATGLDLAAFFLWIDKAPNAKVLFEENNGQRRWPELALEWADKDIRMTGRLDLLVQRENEFWIIDFKVFTKSISRAEVIERYQTQLALYADAVKKMTNASTQDSPQVRAFILDVCAVAAVGSDLLIEVPISR